MYAVFPITFLPAIRTPQLATVILVFCVTLNPFCPIIVVGIVSGLMQRLPFAVTAEWPPIGRFTVMLETGTSGAAANVVVVTPLLIFVLPTTITLTPLASI